MIITLKDGSKKEYAEAKSVIDIAYDISEGLARAACAGEVNGEVVDLRTVLDSDCELNILTARDEKGLAVLRHTASHVMAQAVQNLYPEAKVAIGPSIDTGFYYDFDHEPFSREDLDAIEKEMKKIIKKGAKIEVGGGDAEITINGATVKVTEAGDVEIGSPTKISLTAPEINATAASGDITINGVSLVNHTHMSGAVGKPDK